MMDHTSMMTDMIGEERCNMEVFQDKSCNKLLATLFLIISMVNILFVTKRDPTNLSTVQKIFVVQRDQSKLFVIFQRATLLLVSVMVQNTSILVLVVVIVRVTVTVTMMQNLLLSFPLITRPFIVPLMEETMKQKRFNATTSRSVKSFRLLVRQTIKHVQPFNTSATQRRIADTLQSNVPMDVGPERVIGNVLVLSIT